jgi:methionyl-tRNA synthetase
LVKEGPEGKSRAAAGLRAHLAVIRDLGTALAPFLPHAAASIWAELGDAGVGTNPRAASEVAQIGRDHWPREPRALRLPAKGKLGAVRPVFGKLELSEVLSMFGPNEAEPKSTPAGAKPALVPDATRSPPAGRSESGERASAPASASSASASGGKATEAGATAATPGLLDIAEFQRMLLRVGVVRSVEDHPKADKLYVLRVDLGNEIRQIVAGLREKIPRERLLGARVVVVANLKPAVLRGVESQGMLLAAEDATGTVVPLTTAGDIQPGAKIR